MKVLVVDDDKLARKGCGDTCSRLSMPAHGGTVDQQALQA